MSSTRLTEAAAYEDLTAVPGRQRPPLIPGKSSLAAQTYGMSRPPVQAKRTLGVGYLLSPGAGSAIRERAVEGFEGASGQLPFLDSIQTSFGAHDLSGVQSHVGGTAAAATAAMGATAYASGERVAFGQAPDLHTAAHEAAHVVQQRAGVSLPGGVGADGDRYERDADAIADRVVAGRSAEGLLPAAGTGTSGSRSSDPVQRHPDDNAVIATTEPMEEGAPMGSHVESSGLPAGATAAGQAWDTFAAGFQAGFPAEVVALFGTPPTGERMQQTFTATQRDLISGFLGDHQIPARLFNGGDVASRPAQPLAAGSRQRILVSAHILSTGTYANRQLEQQRVEARNCGHWVTLVNAYAGVGSANASDVRGNFDHRGDVVLHGGQPGRATHDGDALPLGQFDSVEPGDWLYIRASINHSVVFGAWIDQQPRTLTHEGQSYQYRRAITYDQRNNGRGEGGLRHENTNLGERSLVPERGAWIWTITRVEPPQETNVATSPGDLIPAGADLSAAAATNEAGLLEAGISRERAVQWVQEQNVDLIDIVTAPRAGGTRDSRTSPEQQALLEGANNTDDLESLVHLNERLQRLADGIAFLEDAEAATPHPYAANARGPVDRRAPSGFDTTAGTSGTSGTYDTVAERPTTGLLHNVRQPLPGYPSRPRARARRGGRGG